MSESENIMDNQDILENDAFDDALKSLDEQLEEHHQEIDVYDETEQEAIMYEEGVEYTPELDEEDNPEAISYAEQAEESGDFESHEPDEAEQLSNEELNEALDEESEFEAYPTYEEAAEPVEDSVDSIDEEVAYVAEESAEEAAVEAAPTAEAPSMSTASETDDFNLATLNQLVDEIRLESQRVSEMKHSVAEALQLIQEMSESLKS